MVYVITSCTNRVDLTSYPVVKVLLNKVSLFSLFCTLQFTVFMKKVCFYCFKHVFFSLSLSLALQVELFFLSLFSFPTECVLTAALWVKLSDVCIWWEVFTSG